MRGRITRQFGTLCMGIATAVLIFAVGVGAMYVRVVDARSWKVLVAPPGEHLLIALPDGSRAKLNSGSKLLYRLTDDLRELWLLSGEMRVEVAHDNKRPLEVRANRTVVRAVGTAFSVRILDDATTTVTVEEGVVLVRDQPTTLLPDVFIRSHVTRAAGTRLQHPQSATISKGRVDVSHLSDRELIAHGKWPGDLLRVDNMPLTDVLAEFARYGDRRMVKLSDPDIGRLAIGGAFVTHDLDRFLEGLELTGHLSVEHHASPGGEIIEIRAPASSGTSE